MNGSFHEGVYKILQTIKSSGVRLGLMIPPHKICAIEPGLRALGVRVAAITPETGAKELLSADIRAVVYDIAYLNQFPISDVRSAVKMLKKLRLPQIPVLTEADSLPVKNRNLLLKIISDAKICVNPPKAEKIVRSQGVWNKVTQKFFGNKTIKFPVTIKSDYTGDAVTAEGRVYKITGAENVIHLLACEPALYASLCGVCVANGFSYEDAALTAAITVRAASKRALSVTNGPGSFAPVFTDALFQIKRDYIYQIKCEEFSAEETADLMNFGARDFAVSGGVNENSVPR